MILYPRLFLAVVLICCFFVFNIQNLKKAKRFFLLSKTKYWSYVFFILACHKLFPTVLLTIKIAIKITFLENS